MQDKAQPIMCHDCRTPVATIRNGVLVILARHHGENHVTVISLTRPIDNSPVTVVASS